MKNVSISKLHSSLLMGVLAIGALASASHAVAQGTAVKVDVPFAFQNGSQHLPAGTYRIDLNSEHLMILRGATPDAAGFAMTNPEQRSSSIDKGKVVFHRYGGHYYLRAVWIPGSEIGRKCVMSSAEKREKQLQFAQNSTMPSNVEVALNASAW
jgi:hypothetical protein